MMSLKGLGDRIRGEEQARKLPLARIIAAGPPAGSGITLAAWLSSHECDFFACPRRCTTCADPKCKIGSACLAMREIGLDGNGAPLRRRERPRCGARNRQGEPCAVRAEPGKARCRFHGGLSTGPRTIEGRARVAEAQRQRRAKIARDAHLRSHGGQLKLSPFTKTPAQPLAPRSDRLMLMSR
jgi:hypothetical protein